MSINDWANRGFNVTLDGTFFTSSDLREKSGSHKAARVKELKPIPCCAISFAQLINRCTYVPLLMEGSRSLRSASLLYTIGRPWHESISFDDIVD